MSLVIIALVLIVLRFIKKPSLFLSILFGILIAPVAVPIMIALEMGKK